jgi:ribosomal protein L16 Arg81 hydroxylase
MNPFYIKNFISENIFDWNDFNNLLKNHQKNLIETIDQNRIKKYILDNEDLNNKTVIFSNVLNYKKEFNYLINFFKLKVPELKKSFKNDVHVYAGLNETSKSFGEHFDQSANFILQTEGKSRWVISNFLDVVMEPGDIVYIPKLYVHECIPLTKRISLSFPFWF